jgi:membrane protein DedA with SNARE-associated domain
VQLLDRLVEQILALPDWAQGLALALATLASEDLACIASGLLAAGKHMHPVAAIGSAALGIWIGDLLLFLAGRLGGRAILRVPPLRWWLHEGDLELSAAWFRRRGPWVIWATRFVPGTRLPTYVAAGTLGMPLGTFALWTLLAVGVWTPVIGGASMLLGRPVLRWVELYRGWAVPLLLLTVALLFVALKFLVPSFTWRGRRLVLSRWRRLTRWEFWPMWAFYPPVLLYVAWLALRHRSLSVLTAVNPGVYAGGFVGESKFELLSGLARQGRFLAPLRKLEAAHGVEERLESVRRFMSEHGLDYPVVLKPDAGQRGSGVAVARSEADARAYLSQIRVDCLVQEYVSGKEYGIFYYRYPQETRGRVFSITSKVFPAVLGDGRKTLERLILEDDRAVCLARHYLECNRRRLELVPGPGERVQLVEIGNHCRGTVFLDGTALRTPELEACIDSLSQSLPGFYFGRYDVRVPSEEDLRAGRNLRVIELNGATSEATSIYDPSHGLLQAWGTLFEQWRILFAIAAENRRRGAREVHWIHWPGLLARYRAGARSHPSSLSTP